MNTSQLNRDRALISFTAFMHFLGMTLAFPVFIPLMSSASDLLPPEYSKELRGLLLGLLLGLYPLVQFFTAPILGVLSDRIGRKPVLIVSAIGNMAGNAILAAGIITHEIWIVVAGRIISGCFSGSLAVTQSAMSDISNESNRSANFGLMGAMMGASLALGPAIGGVLSDSRHGPLFTLATPFIAATILGIINVILLIGLLYETLHKEHRQLGHFNILTGPKNFTAAFIDPRSRQVFIVVFLLGFGFNFFAQFFQYYLIERFAVTNTQFGMLFGYVGIWAILAQGVFNRPLSRRFKPAQILRVTIVSLSVMFPILLLVPSYPLLYAVAFIIPLMNGLSIPNMTVLVAGMADQKGQGKIMGVNQAVQAVSMLAAPLIGGYLVGLNYTLPIWGAGAFVFAAWLFFLPCYKKSCAGL